MTRQITIAVDAMGGDNAPIKVIDGILKEMWIYIAIVSRANLSKIENDPGVIIPDVIIIDGGKGHLIKARKLLDKYNKNQIKLIAVAKGRERNSGREIIYYNNKEKILKKNDPLLHFIQRIRDEAHRFAITSHRRRRDKESIHSIFDEIQGVGAKRKKILLEHFGNIESIKNATINELNGINGINKNLAEQIYGFFNEQ